MPLMRYYISIATLFSYSCCCRRRRCSIGCSSYTSVVVHYSHSKQQTALLANEYSSGIIRPSHMQMTDADFT